jgi:hypothetical protein
MKPKEWLYKQGHIAKIGRGRMSAEHKSLIEAALLADPSLRIEGFSVSAGKPADESVAAKPTVERVKTDANRLLDVPDMRRDERDWSARVSVDGKTSEIGFRTVCNGCGNSLGWCYEGTSRVWVDTNREATVEFIPRKKGAG